jgi:hypothetical protein
MVVFADSPISAGFLANKTDVHTNAQVTSIFGSPAVSSGVSENRLSGSFSATFLVCSISESEDGRPEKDSGESIVFPSVPRRRRP